MVTNDDFLAEIFGLDIPSGAVIFTCSFPGDPSAGDYRPKPNYYPADHNNYFCVSTLTELRRLEKNFAALHCLVVDDVGTKVPESAVHTKLGTPTWILETSPGNYQWGYKLSRPVTDPALANGLIQALCHTFGISDMAGVNRLVRLPVGMNGKKSLAAPFTTRLTLWQPGQRLNADHVAEDLRAVPVPIEDQSLPFLPEDRDPVVLAMALRGHRYEATRDPGRYRVQCPWVDTHSAGRDDGAAYIAPSGFKCHHGHCASKTFADFREFLGLSAREIDQAKLDADTENYFASEGLVVESTCASSSESPMSGEGGGAPTPPPAKDWSVKRFHNLSEHRPLIPGETGAEVFERQWLFKDIVPADGMWILAGHGGEGKSRLAMALCMCAAAGLPMGPFKPVNKQGVRTLFVTQEDDDAEKFHRYRTQYEAFCRHDDRWEEKEIGERLERNLFMPDFDPIEGLSKENQKRILDMQKADGIFELVIWDPLIMFSEAEDDDHGLNSAAGSKATLAKLTQVSKRIAKATGGRTSVGFLHHLNKNGGLMGSAMLTNLNRLVFGMTVHPYPPPGKRQSVLTVLKANTSHLREKTCTVELEGDAATVWINDPVFGVPPAPPEAAEADPEPSSPRSKSPRTRR